ncbi:hypothetical protein [Salisaeta longa]|uniref:hypothetical protein n=1 Tax=Salisaeta longa TaxID=503170 RepID=UPI0003B44500|nr:hypothetical protein [Salisaeta longa]
MKRAICGLLVWSAVFCGSAAGQAPSIVERYQHVRRHQLAVQVLHGGLPALPPARLPVAGDTLRTGAAADASATDASAGLPFAITEQHKVSKLGRSWFTKKFEGTPWAFLGRSDALTLLDTTRTAVLRARLQAQFGDPTQTLGDFNLRRPRDSYVQFEYWFVVNDSIPVKVSDVGGPGDRGLIFATHARYRPVLHALRDSVLAPVRHHAARAVYVDYWFEADARRWYRVGYDGARFFRERVYRYQLTPGRRPWIDGAATP